MGSLWDDFGFNIRTTLGVVWGHFEGTQGDVHVVTLGHCGGTLGVTLGVLLKVL